MTHEETAQKIVAIAQKIAAEFDPEKIILYRQMAELALNMRHGPS